MAVSEETRVPLIYNDFSMPMFKSSSTDQSTQTPSLLTQLKSFGSSLDEKTSFLELSFSDFAILEAFSKMRHIGEEIKETGMSQELFPVPAIDKLFDPKTEDVSIEGSQLDINQERRKDSGHGTTFILKGECEGTESKVLSRDNHDSVHLKTLSLIRPTQTKNQAKAFLEDLLFDHIPFTKNQQSRKDSKEYLEGREVKLMENPAFPIETNATSLKIKSEVLSEEDYVSQLRTVDVPLSPLISVMEEKILNEEQSLDINDEQRGEHMDWLLGTTSCEEEESSRDRETLLIVPKVEESSCLLNIKLIPLEQQEEEERRSLHACNICHLTFEKETLLLEHLTSHVLLSSFTCNVCSLSFDDLKKLKEHQDTHKNRMFCCKECHRSFPLSILLKKHHCTRQAQKSLTIPNQDSKPRLFCCTFCPSTFSFQSDLDQHLVKHSGIKRFKCPSCPKRFTYKSSLQAHHLQHTGEKPFPCPQCEKWFTKQSQLDRHLITHTGEKPFQCSQCKKRFGLKSNLKTHLSTHTRERRFPCPHCERSFTYNSILTEHLFTHTGEKPFQCPQCQKKFIRKGKLNRHLLTHNKKKPFQCPQCQKKFAHKGRLDQHLLTHEEKNPFLCPHCKERFSHKRILNQHLLLTHILKNPVPCPKVEVCCTQESHLSQHLQQQIGELTLKMRPILPKPGSF